MSKPKVTANRGETENPALQAATPPAKKAPSRTVGFTLMTLMIIFAGFWLGRQSNRQADEIVDMLPVADSASTGFNSQLWYLPDEPLLGFVEIPAGAFVMGSNPALDAMAYENERWSGSLRQGSVALPAYYIGRFEVTVAQFRAYTQAAQRTRNTSDAQPGNWPVTNVTWAEALGYARWLEQRLLETDAVPNEIKQLLRAGARVTLPNEAEWEKAARGTDGRIFPWGSEPTSQYANFGGGEPRPVGATECPACSYGLADMSGNVWEFTRSPLQDYPFDSTDDFVELSLDPIYVMRGGSYADQINNVRAAVRGGVDPGVRSDTIGFRLVISTL